MNIYVGDLVQGYWGWAWAPQSSAGLYYDGVHIESTGWGPCGSAIKSSWTGKGRTLTHEVALRSRPTPAFAYGPTPRKAPHAPSARPTPPTPLSFNSPRPTPSATPPRRE